MQTETRNRVYKKLNAFKIPLNVAKGLEIKSFFIDVGCLGTYVKFKCLLSRTCL